MKTVKNLWAYNKFTAVVLVITTIGWIALTASMWWLLAFIGAGLSWVLLMAGVTALMVILFWVIWDAFGRVVN